MLVTFITKQNKYITKTKSEICIQQNHRKCFIDQYELECNKPTPSTLNRISDLKLKYCLFGLFLTVAIDHNKHKLSTRITQVAMILTELA